MTTILVTGATGTIGSALIPLLRARGVDVRALVRNPDRAQRISAASTQIVKGDFSDRASLRAAVDGVDTVFLACGNVPERVEYECAVIDEADSAGAQGIVTDPSPEPIGRLWSKFRRPAEERSNRARLCSTG